MSHLMKSVIVSMPMNCCLTESQRGQARTPKSHCSEEQITSQLHKFNRRIFVNLMFISSSASDPDPLDPQYLGFLDPDPDSRSKLDQIC